MLNNPYTEDEGYTLLKFFILNVFMPKHSIHITDACMLNLSALWTSKVPKNGHNNQEFS